MTRDFDSKDFHDVHPLAPERVKRRDPEQLVREIAASEGVRVADMMGPSRFQHLVAAREVLYRTLRSWGWSLPAIGHFVNRDHTTILYALKTPEERAASKLRKLKSPSPGR